MTLLYNLVMLAVDLATIRLLSERKGLPGWWGVMACAGGTTLLVALPAGLFEDHFGVFRLWAYGVFFHGTVLLVATTCLWWRYRRATTIWAAVGATAVILLAVYVFMIEPYRLEVCHYQIASPKIHRPVRIVVVADLQTNRIGPYEIDALRRALEEKPDIILMAGDYLQVPDEQQEELQGQLHDLLRKIHFTAAGGVFAIQGNVDPPGWEKIFDGLGVTTVNAERSFNLGDLQLTCLGLEESRNTAIKIAAAPDDKFHLVLGHVPNFALGNVKADLLVAGHTHGGQVRFPGFGAVMIHSRIPRAWAAGLTDLPRGGRLLVSRGIGMERGYAPPMRFLCRPELMVIDLTPEEKETTDEHR